MHATKKPPFTSTLTNVLDGSSRSISPRTHSGTVHAGFVAVAVGIFSLSPPPPRTTKKCILLLPLYSVPFCRGKERGKFLLPSSSFSHIHSLSFLPAPPRFIHLPGDCEEEEDGSVRNALRVPALCVEQHTFLSSPLFQSQTPNV